MHQLKCLTEFKLCCLFLIGLLSTASLAETSNMALNRPYTVYPSTNYFVLTEKGDYTQLTDGKYAPEKVDTAWVGWSGTPKIIVNIDLGQICNVTEVIVSGFSNGRKVRLPKLIGIYIDNPEAGGWFDYLKHVPIANDSDTQAKAYEMSTTMTGVRNKPEGRFLKIEIVPHKNKNHSRPIENQNMRVLLK